MIRRAGAFQSDLVDQATWIAYDSLDAADRHIAAVDETLRALEKLPRMGRPWRSRARGLRGVRTRAVREFPNHLIFYRPIDGGVEALRLLHAARDLGRALREP